MSEISYSKVYETPFFTVESTENYCANGEPYFRINTKDSIICCLLDKWDNILLVEQFRPNLGYSTIEFPAGGIEDGETPHNAAIREIQEEIGMNCDLFYLGRYRLMMNRTINSEHLFLGLTDGKVIGKSEHGIQMRSIARKQFSEFINAGNIEQLAALGLIKLIDLRFKIDFLSDDIIINKIWK